MLGHLRRRSSSQMTRAGRSDVRLETHRFGQCRTSPVYSTPVWIEICVSGRRRATASWISQRPPYPSGQTAAPRTHPTERGDLFHLNRADEEEDNPDPACSRLRLKELLRQ